MLGHVPDIQLSFDKNWFASEVFLMSIHMKNQRVPSWSDVSQSTNVGAVKCMILMQLCGSKGSSQKKTTQHFWEWIQIAQYWKTYTFV